MSLPSDAIEVIGREVLLSSATEELFGQGKTWVARYWSMKSRPVEKIHIKEKTIGKREGFIMCVSVSNPVEEVRYYAKVQTARIETVMTHYLLKYTNCGPDAFLIVLLLPGWFYNQQHGIITLEVPGFIMATSLTEKDLNAISENEQLMWSQSFLLTFLSELGHFSHIPSNKENWGYATDPNCVDKQALQRVVVVDFSSTGQQFALHSEGQFRMKWLHNLILYISTNTLALRLPTIQEQLQYIPWLQSKKVFRALLQQVITSTMQWMQQHIKPQNTLSTTHDTTTHDTQSVLSVPLQHLWNVRTIINLPIHMGSLGREFADWISRWRKQCTAVCQWMPFVKHAKVKYTVQVVVVRQKFHLRRKHMKYTYIV